MSQKANNLITRIKKELSIKKDKDLCQLLDIKHNTLSTWKKRDTIDFNKILKLCEDHSLDLNYIFFEGETDEETKGKEIRKKRPVEEIIPHIKVSVDILMSSKLVTTNRNIAIFFSRMFTNNDLKKEEIIIAQQISLKKLTEHTSYVIQTELDKYYNDHLNFNGGNAELTLKDQHITILKKSIKNVWQVLDRSENIIIFLKKTNENRP